MESLVGPANLVKLRSLPAGLELPLSDATTRISRSSDNASRTQAALEAGIYLSNIDHVTENNDQVANLAKVVGESLLSIDETEPDKEAFALAAEAGIACLQLLSSTWSCSLDDSTLLKLVSFTDLRDPWTTEKAASVASDILQENLIAEKLTAFVVGPVLQAFLKPLFAKSSSRVTESGRPDRYHSAADLTRQPRKSPGWKSHASWAVTVVRWSVEVSDASLLQAHWPLFTPVLLALVEDESIPVKSKGLEILASFVRKCPPSVLHTTGIGRVFEDATFPALLYLPDLTPEDESIELLVPAYKVLITLAETYPSPQSPERRQLLDKLLREGVFAAYFHASQHARLVQTLMENMESVVKCLGIYSIKHLKNILSVTSSVMEDPFATAYPPAVVSTVKALQATITACWPRLQEGANFEQIIRSLSLCWLNLCEDGDTPATDSDTATALSQALIQTAKILEAVWSQTHTTPPAGWSEVLEKDSRLSKLFPALSS